MKFKASVGLVGVWGLGLGLCFIRRSEESCFIRESGDGGEVLDR